MTFPVAHTTPHERRSGECGGNLAVRVRRPRARVGHASWLVAGRAASHTTLDSTVLRLRVALKKKRRHPNGGPHFERMISTGRSRRSRALVVQRDGTGQRGDGNHTAPYPWFADLLLVRGDNTISYAF